MNERNYTFADGEQLTEADLTQPLDLDYAANNAKSTILAQLLDTVEGLNNLDYKYDNMAYGKNLGSSINRSIDTVSWTSLFPDFSSLHKVNSNLGHDGTVTVVYRDSNNDYRIHRVDLETQQTTDLYTISPSQLPDTQVGPTGSAYSYSVEDIMFALQDDDKLQVTKYIALREEDGNGTDEDSYDLYHSSKAFDSTGSSLGTGSGQIRSDPNFWDSSFTNDMPGGDMFNHEGSGQSTCGFVCHWRQDGDTDDGEYHGMAAVKYDASSNSFGYGWHQTFQSDEYDNGPQSTIMRYCSNNTIYHVVGFQEHEGDDDQSWVNYDKLDLPNINGSNLHYNNEDAGTDDHSDYLYFTRHLNQVFFGNFHDDDGSPDTATFNFRGYTEDNRWFALNNQYDDPYDQVSFQYFPTGMEMKMEIDHNNGNDRRLRAASFDKTATSIDRFSEVKMDREQYFFIDSDGQHKIYNFNGTEIERTWSSSSTLEYNDAISFENDIDYMFPYFKFYINGFWTDLETDLTQGVTLEEGADAEVVERAKWQEYTIGNRPDNVFISLNLDGGLLNAGTNLSYYYLFYDTK